MKHRGIILLTLLTLLFFYTGLKVSQVYEHFGTPFTPQKRWSAWLIALVFVFLAIGWQFIYHWNTEALDTTWFRVLVWTGSICLGFWAIFLLFSLIFDACHIIVLAFSKLSPSFINSLSPDPERRKFLSRCAGIGLAGISGGLAGIISFAGFIEAMAGAKLKTVVIPIEDLPDGLKGLKIAQISDLHVGPTIRHSYVENIVAQVNSLEADIIAITGDLVDGSPESLDYHLRPLQKLKARLGVFYVTGNHEYYWGVENWIEKVTQLGFIPLLNQNRIVEHQGIKILVAGVTDTSGHQFLDSHRSDPKKAANAQEQCPFRLLLAHRPDSCFEAEPFGFHLQLSGHTHAGQFFPWSLFVRLAHKYYKGLNRHERMWVYVNSGSGYWGPANRFANRSEITLLQLSKENSTKASEKV